MCCWMFEVVVPDEYMFIPHYLQAALKALLLSFGIVKCLYTTEGDLGVILVSK